VQLVWDGELAASEIASQFDVSFSAISQHLRVLEQAGFVACGRDIWTSCRGSPRPTRGAAVV